MADQTTIRSKSWGALVLGAATASLAAWVWSMGPASDAIVPVGPTSGANFSPPAPTAAADDFLRSPVAAAGESTWRESRPEQSGPAPEPSRPPDQRSLRSHYQRLCRSHPIQAREEALRLLGSDGEDGGKVAMLGALVAAGHADAPSILVVAATTLPQQDSPRGESVPAIAVRLLCERASTDPAARDGLRRLAFEPSSVSPALRERAATVWAATAPAADRETIEALAANLVDGPLQAALRHGLTAPAKKTAPEPNGVPE